MKSVNVGNSNFKELIESDGLYVDKTKYLFDLIANSGSEKYYFLSRPRRFGKSLTINTLECIFKGEKELFKETYIYDKYSFEEYPVIKICLNKCSSSSKEALFQSLKNNIIYPVAFNYGVENKIPFDVEIPSIWLFRLIFALYSKFDKKVVVLIDEYDYPLLESVTSDVFEDIRSAMEDFYSVLKGSEDYIKFCFITGITRFSQVSIFSKLNNLVNISEEIPYVSICGFTDDEIDTYFKPYFEAHLKEESGDYEVFRKKVKDYYDGYRFSPNSETKLYNPVSIAYFTRRNNDFDTYWIDTGAQTRVKEIISLYPSYFSPDAEFKIPASITKTFEAKQIFSGNANRALVYSYLFQAGYLTIGEGDGIFLTLCYPNVEVKDAMLANILSLYGFQSATATLVNNVENALLNGDVKRLVECYQSFYLDFPYDVTLEKEQNYQIALYSSLLTIRGSGVKIEDHTNKGRIDISVSVDESSKYYIIELKLDKSAKDAIAQIKSKKYYEKFSALGERDIYLVGINFSSKERNIAEWDFEIMRS